MARQRYDPSCGVEYKSYLCSRKVNSDWMNQEDITGECCKGGTYS